MFQRIHETSRRPLLLILAVLALLAGQFASAATVADINGQIASIVAGSNSNVQWSVLIENQWGTQTYYSLNPDTPRRPASNTKIFTTAGALGLLGPTYTWRGYQLQSSSTSSPVEDVLAYSDNVLADELYGLVGSGSSIINWCSARGINMTGAQMYDGSGLNYDNRFTSRQTLQLVRYMMNNYTYSQWATHLAISCNKGTLASRMCGTATTGRVHAKTGTLTNGLTLSLSGYIDNVNDSKRYYFSIYTNNVPSSAQSDTLSRIDSIVTVMSQAGIPNPGPSLGGIIVDNSSTTAYMEWGTWSSSANPGYYGSNSRWASCVNANNNAAWVPTIATQGLYDVYVWYVAGTNRSPAASYIINHKNGATTLWGNNNSDGIPNGINQQQNGSVWVKLGQWEFAAGTSGSVYLDGANSLNGGNTSAVVSADAVQFVLVQATGQEFIVDNTDAGFTAPSANWFASTSTPGYYGSNYHARATASASDAATWRVNLADSGSYEVFVRWTSGTNRAAAAPYIVYHAGGSTTKNMNQQQNGGTWVSLGTYTFNAGDTTRVGLSCWTTAGYYVIADAVKLVKK